MAQQGGKRPGAGRKKGQKAAHTLQAEAAKAQLIEAYKKSATKINAALVAKAEGGDIMAIKELHDRVWGKAYQAGEMDLTSGGAPLQLTDDQYKQALAAAIKRSGRK